MGDWGIAIELGILFGLLGLGVFVGSLVAATHRRSLIRREAALADLLVTNQRRAPMPTDHSCAPRLVLGQAVLGCDH
ncbi:MAG: hypothetical protein EA402_10810 [Planctomycetota bacterium]|nr:MAG: hypothetical protein EA402_10810 [Planctomycetota bacterium]